MEKELAIADLAINGGSRIRNTPMPRRKALGAQEIKLLMEAVNYYYQNDVDPGYQSHYENLYCQAFSSFMGGGFTDAVATGSGAIYIGIAALNLPKGGHVLVSPITDPGTISAIILNGLKVKILDTHVNDYNVCIEEIEKRYDTNVCAIVLVHSIGRPIEDIEKIAEFAKQKSLYLVEDCSQSHGAKVNGKFVGTFGDIAAFSTMYRKIHMTGGSGGVIYSKDEHLFNLATAHADRGKQRWLHNFDDRNPENFLFPALNWNTNELSCAIGLSSLSRLEKTIELRKKFIFSLAKELHNELSDCFSCLRFSEECAPFIYPIFVDPSISQQKKIDIANAIFAEGIDLNPHYRYLTTTWRWVEPYLADRYQPKNASQAIDRSFCLYLNENYGVQEVRDSIDAMRKVASVFKL